MSSTKGSIPVDVYESKVFKKACKTLGDKEAKELLEKTDDQLKMVVAENILRKEDLVSKLKENSEYVKAKDIVTTLEGGMKDTMKDSNLVAKLAKVILKARS